MRKKRHNADKYRKDGKPRKVIKCYSCGKVSMRAVKINRTFVSGDGHYYECKCGANDSTII